MNRYFLVVSPGLERLLYQEIQDYLPRLRTNPAKVYFTTGGIELDLSKEESYLVISKSRLLESLRLRLSRFHASQWYELENGVNHLPLSIISNQYKQFNIDLHISSHQSSLYHSKAIEERILKTRLMKEMSLDSKNAIPLYFYFNHNMCQVSVEIGGNYKRGYRKYIGQTPLRETLAAAVSYSSLHHLSPPFSIIDPFCGSGTILQESISFLENDYPFLQQQHFHLSTNSIMNEYFSTINLPSLSQSSSHAIQYSVYGNDIDRKVLQAAEKNFELLYQSTNSIPYSLTNKSFHEYKNCISKECQEKLVVVSNPPYGHRSKSKNQSTISLYHELCDWLLELQKSQQLASASILFPSFIFNDHLPDVFKKQCKICYMTNNRGLPVHLVTL